MIEQIKSIRESLNKNYSKPDPREVEEAIVALKNNDEALSYLKYTRGLTENTIEHFKLGYDAEKNAITIPIYKEKELINIRYRFIGEDAKQRYSQKKGCELWLFNDVGVDKARSKGKIIVVEGEIDCMSVWQAGFKEVISAASGKDSYGPWIELLDSIPNVYIAYDNDKPGKQSAKKLADRIGIDKCFEVEYGDVKDANEFFKKYQPTDFFERVKKAKPFYKYEFPGVSEIVEELRIKGSSSFFLDMLPIINWNDVHVLVASGSSGAGKTSLSLNVANELVEKKIPTVVFPFERGITTAGKRFLQVRYGIDTQDFDFLSDEKWDSILSDSVNLPIYFSKPSREDFVDVVKRAYRLFGVQYFIIDHLDYFTYGKDQLEKQKEIMYTIEELAQELDVKFIVVHHINKTDGTGFSSNRRPNKEMLSGASEIYKIPEAVVFVWRKNKEDNFVEFIVDKNKGEERDFVFDFNQSTGIMKLTKRDVTKTEEDVEKAFEDF
jgi:twinkle protein